MGLGKKRFTRRNSFQKGGELYRWAPVINEKSAKTDGVGKNFYCTATHRSQGEDWRVTYVYKIVVVDGIQKRIAYVACDYVQ